MKDSISPLFLKNNTIVKNYGYGIYIPSGRDPCLINNIIWQNGNSVNKNIYSANGFDDIEAFYNCIEGGFPGTGNISCDPCFVNPDINDFHLNLDSLCIDTGDPYADYEDDTDIDGQCRIMWGNSDERADIGADEFAPKADYNGDSVVNFLDFAKLAGTWESMNSPAITLDDDNDVDINDLALFCNDWLWIASCSPLYEMLESLSQENLMANETSEPVESIEIAQVTIAEESYPDDEETPSQTFSDEEIQELVDWLTEVRQQEPEIQETAQVLIDSLNEQLND